MKGFYGCNSAWWIIVSLRRPLQLLLQDNIPNILTATCCSKLNEHELARYEIYWNISFIRIVNSNFRLTCVCAWVFPFILIYLHASQSHMGEFPYCFWQGVANRCERLPSHGYPIFPPRAKARTTQVEAMFPLSCRFIMWCVIVQLTLSVTLKPSASAGGGCDGRCHERWRKHSWLP